jgi:hypothetical protein
MLALVTVSHKTCLKHYASGTSLGFATHVFGPIISITYQNFRQTSFQVCPLTFAFSAFSPRRGLEEIVSKHLDRAYGAGGCRHGIKIKNPAHLAYSRGQGEHCSTIVTHDCRRTDTKDLRHP